MHHLLILFMHHIELLFLYLFCANLQFALGFYFFFPWFFSVCPSSPTFDSDRFLSEKNQEVYEKLNLKRNIWAERKVLLDELDPEIRHNFERRGWLPLLDVDHPPSATLIREFYLNLFVHSYDSNTLVRSWIWGDEYTITPSVVVATLGVPMIWHLVYPYNESSPLDDIMSYITGSSIQWGSDPRITTTKLIEIHYLFFRIDC